MTTSATLGQQQAIPTISGDHVPTMKALVYLGPGKRGFEQRPKPVLSTSTDAIVKIAKTTIF